MRFTKMHGLGNDFIVIDCRKKKIAELSKLMKKLSHRQFGIGFDQAIILLPSKKADFRMDIYNADGGRVEMCGNGIRCIAKYIWDRKLSKKDVLDIETLAGIIKPKKAGNLIKVDMGAPILEAKDIPMKIGSEFGVRSWKEENSKSVVDYPLRIENKEFKITCVSMGNPHCVIFVDDVNIFPVTQYGPIIENHSLFPKRTNVEFVEIVSKKELKMRVWERGSGETLACGTGACASAVAAHLNKLAGRKVTVHLAGGDLKIDWSEKDNHVYMTGPAIEVFEGFVKVPKNAFAFFG
ncbi:MAG: diaminopimelate epimerase [Deltaproteobacteria bacterium]|nr:diaminopimelate epimerase [Deltaproteobacteria bacterium]